jgi:hypothetical protein
MLGRLLPRPRGLGLVQQPNGLGWPMSHSAHGAPERAVTAAAGSAVVRRERARQWQSYGEEDRGSTGASWMTGWAGWMWHGLTEWMARRWEVVCTVAFRGGDEGVATVGDVLVVQ